MGLWIAGDRIRFASSSQDASAFHLPMLDRPSSFRSGASSASDLSDWHSYFQWASDTPDSGTLGQDNDMPMSSAATSSPTASLSPPYPKGSTGNEVHQVVRIGSLGLW